MTLDKTKNTDPIGKNSDGQNQINYNDILSDNENLIHKIEDIGIDSEDYFKSFIKTSFSLYDFLFLIDSLGEIKLTYINKEDVQFADITGSNFFMHLPLEHHDQLGDILSEIIEQDRIKNFFSKNILDKESSDPCCYNISRLKSNSVPQLFLVLAKTIKLPKENFLSDSHSGFSERAEKSNQGILLIQDGKVLFANLSIYKLTGLSADQINEMKNESILEVIHSEDHEQFLKFQKKLNDNILPEDKILIRFLKNTSVTKWFEITATPFEINKKPAFQVTISDISESIGAMQKLMLGKEQFEKAFRVTQDLLLIISVANGRILDVNRKFEEITSYTRKEIIGKTTVSIGLWLSLETKGNLIDELSYSHEFRNKNIEFLKKNGNTFTGLASGTLIEIDGEKCLLITARDVKEQIVTLKELHKRNEILQAIGDAVNILLETGDFENNINTLLKRLGIASGASRVYIFENSVYDNADLTMVRKYEWVAATTSSSSESSGMENYSYSKYGLDRWIKILEDNSVINEKVSKLPESEKALLSKWSILSILIVPIFIDGDWWGFIGFDECHLERNWSQAEIDSLKTAAGIIGSYIGQEQKQMELAKSEQKFRILAENVPGVIYLCLNDEFYTMLYLNDEIKKLTGYKKEKLLSSEITYSSLCHPDDLPYINSEVNKAVKNNEPFHLVYRIKNKSGDWRWVEEHGKGVFINNELAFLEGHILDITDKKERDQKLIDSLKEKGILLQELHHRVKNNLQVISSLLDLQFSRIEDENVKMIFSESRNRIKTLAIIHEKMYISGDLTEIDLGEYLTNLVNSLCFSYNPDHENFKPEVRIVELRIDIDTAIPIALIVNELISNSLRHAFPDDRERMISVYSDLVDDKLLLTVSDNGIGLPDLISLESTDTLGLHLVSMLAKQIKAEIQINRGNGSTFIVSIPLSPKTNPGY